MDCVRVPGRACAASPIWNGDEKHGSSSHPLLVENNPDMRRRVTFIHPKDHQVDQETIPIAEGAVHVQKLRAAREDRIIASLYELPQEVT